MTRHTCNACMQMVIKYPLLAGLPTKGIPAAGTIIEMYLPEHPQVDFSLPLHRQAILHPRPLIDLNYRLTGRDKTDTTTIK